MEQNSCFCCPICGGELSRVPGRLCCPKGHSFDVAASGYVNLLRRNGSGRIHGDDRDMVAARRRFLSKGYYTPLLSALSRLLAEVPDGGRVLDCGCGEGWYTSGLAQNLGREITLLGVDISKRAVDAAAKRGGGEYAVCSLFDLPVASGTVDAILNLFAPAAAGEFSRVLRPGGCLIRVLSAPGHLMELKQAVYDHPRPNLPEPPALEGFELTREQELSGRILLKETQDILDLFAMTPYVHKTAARDAEKLTHLEQLETEIGFCIRCYRRREPNPIRR